MSEFSVIADYFAQQGMHRKDVLLGIGDDAAIVDSSQTKQLVLAVDTMNEGVHFPQNTNPYDIGWKVLAVNLSDMAAMGAKPLWFTLAISLPRADENWLAQFTQGLFAIAEKYQVQLIGGDTTRGPLSVSVQITGEYSINPHMQRANAQPGDQVYVTGCLGDAALGLLSLKQELPLTGHEQEQLLTKLNRPEPRVQEALAFSHLVNAAIDISDGLQADLSHILKASEVGAKLFVDKLPVSNVYRNCCQGAQMFDLALTGGDDYELCLTVPQENEKQFLQITDEVNCKVTKIGEIIAGEGLQLLQANGEAYVLHKRAYDHFV